MTTRAERLLLWSPRILGTLVAMFIGLFSLDAFSQGRSLSRELVDFAVHSIPTLLLVALVATSWRRPWLGGVGFTALAAAYATVARHHLDWVLVIAGPLLIVGVLFFWSWRSSNRAAISR